jgi:ABC-type uncharacterized transport system permease subunit
MLSVPIELMTRAHGSGEAIALILGQLAWAVASLGVALWAWRRGVKRYEAVGG